MLDFNMLLPSFVMFVREQDPSKTYDYDRTHECAWTEFMHSQGYRDASTNPVGFRADDLSPMTHFPEGFNELVLWTDYDDHSFAQIGTFGALSKRLDAYIKAHPINLVAGEL